MSAPPSSTLGSTLALPSPHRSTSVWRHQRGATGPHGSPARLCITRPWSIISARMKTLIRGGEVIAYHDGTHRLVVWAAPGRSGVSAPSGMSSRWSPGDGESRAYRLLIPGLGKGGRPDESNHYNSGYRGDGLGRLRDEERAVSERSLPRDPQRKPLRLHGGGWCLGLWIPDVHRRVLISPASRRVGPAVGDGAFPPPNAGGEGNRHGGSEALRRRATRGDG